MTDGNVFAPSDAAKEDGDAQEQILTYLRQTRPWVLLLAVLTGLSSMLMVGGGLFVTLAGAAIGMDAGMGGLEAAIGLVYVAIGAMYAVPTFLLGRYGLASSPTDLDGAALAVRYQRDFWRVVGMFTLALIALYCGGILLVSISAVFAAGN